MNWYEHWYDYTGTIADWVMAGAACYAAWKARDFFTNKYFELGFETANTLVNKWGAVFDIQNHLYDEIQDKIARYSILNIQEFQSVDVNNELLKPLSNSRVLLIKASEEITPIALKFLNSGWKVKSSYQEGYNIFLFGIVGMPNLLTRISKALNLMKVRSESYSITHSESDEKDFLQYQNEIKNEIYLLNLQLSDSKSNSDKFCKAGATARDFFRF